MYFVAFEVVCVLVSRHTAVRMPIRFSMMDHVGSVRTAGRPPKGVAQGRNLAGIHTTRWGSRPTYK